MNWSERTPTTEWSIDVPVRFVQPRYIGTITSVDANQNDLQYRVIELAARQTPEAQHASPLALVSLAAIASVSATPLTRRRFLGFLRG